MAAVLPPFQPRQGILLNPSPTSSPYAHPSSLPSTPHLLSSYSSLSSTSSSSPSHTTLGDTDHYFLASTSSSPLAPPHSSLPPTSAPLTRLAHKPRSGSSPAASSSLASRRIRFAPLPDPRREVLVTEEGKELPLPPVFFNEADECDLQSHPHIFSVRDNLVAAVQVAHGSAPDGAANPPSSLLFSNTPNGIALVEALSPTSPVATRLHTSESSRTPTCPKSFKGPESDKDSDLDPLSPSTSDPVSALSSSTSSLPPSYGDLDSSVTSSPKIEKKSWASRKLLRPFFGRNGSKDSLAEEGSEDGALTLVRSESRGSTKKAKRASQSSGEPPLQTFGRSESNNTITSIKRPSTAPSSSAGTGPASSTISPYPPLHQIPTPRPTNPNPNSKPRTLFSSPTATSLSMSLFSRNNSSTNPAFGRSQSLTSDLRRVQSGGSVKSTKSLNSALSAKKQQQQAQGVRRGQLKMLNGRVYGARRVDPFANVRAEEPEFVEWGYGGMGSVNNHLHSSEGNIWAKVQSSAGMSIGALDNESWGSSRSGSVTGSGESMRSARTGSGRGTEDDDDGSGMTWVRRRREMRERERREAELKKALEKKDEGLAVKESKEDGESHTTPTSTVFNINQHPSSATTSATATPTIPHQVSTPTSGEHITTAITLPPLRPHGHHHSHSLHHRTASSSTIQPVVPGSVASSASTTATSTPMPSGAITPTGGSLHVLKTAPERRGSADTARGVPLPQVSLATEEQQVSVSSPKVEEPVEEPVTPRSEDGSPSGSGEEDEGDDSDEDENDEELTRRTAVGAGVEKISRHKDHVPSTNPPSLPPSTAASPDPPEDGQPSS